MLLGSCGEAKMGEDEAYGDEDAPPIVDDARVYNVILWAPFVIIPVSIIAARFMRFVWRYYQAKVYGFDEDLFSDPLSELGLSLTRGYSNTADIRKIRKEQQKIQAKQVRHERGSTAREREQRDASTTLGTRRFMTGFAPLDAAENYFHDLTRRTRRTWTDRLSPEAIRRWIDVSRWARLWMIFQVLCTVAAIVNYVLLTYSIQRRDRRHIKYFDLFLAAMFLLDYMLSFYTAEDCLRFYFNPGSLIDLLSIVPPFVYVLISETSQYVWFLGLLRILRASRILRTYRLLSFSETEEKRELTILALTFMNFVFLSASIINALESIHQGKPDDASLENWHDSLYYIMVTFSTIGFGDLTPSSVPSRMIVMVLIVFVLIFVPLQTGKVAEIYNSTSAYQRAKYALSGDHAHIIIAGTVSYNGIVDFCREYFTADPEGHVVVLYEEEPSMEVRKLMRHPFYRNRLYYLRGTALNANDLKRAQANFATALFLLNQDSPTVADAGTEESELRVTRGMDAQILMMSLTAKNFVAGLPIFAEVQDIRSQDLSQTCGCDRILCIDEIKMALLARNCLVPGLLTLVLNLVHTYKDARMTADLFNPWTQEYQHGAGHQIVSFKIPAGLVGVRFHHVVQEIYQTFGAIVFAVMSANAGFNTNPIRLNPGREYRFKDDDIAFAAADGGDEFVLRVLLQYKDTAIRDELNLMELDKELDDYVTSSYGSDMASPGKSSFQKSAILESSDPSSTDVDKNMPPLPPNSLSLGISSHIILCGNMTSRGIRHFIRSIRTSTITTPPLTPVSAYATTPIVCLLEYMPETTDGIWAEIFMYPDIHIVRGNPLKRTSLLMAGVDRCSRMVIFAKNQKAGGGNTDMPDANSVFIVKMLQKEWPNAAFTVELADGVNVKFFSAKNTWNADNLRMQSLLNNYALSLNDRIALYKKFRMGGVSDRASQGFLFRLLKFFTAKPPEGATNTGRYAQSKVRPKAKKTFKHEDAEVLFAAHGADVPMADLSPNRGHADPVHNEDSDSDSESDMGEEAPMHQAGNSDSVTTAYLTRLLNEAELNETGLSPFPAYHFDRHFAAGMVTISCFMHSLLSQSYFRPYVIDAVRALANAVMHLRVPHTLHGRKYGELATWCLERGVVPLGLYRDAHKKGAASGTILEADTLPFVYTNCRSFDIVHKEDLVFVIKEMTA
ncbi:hypothetical protein BC832DRAFT_597262 [Gaertneriomyces semiglobifer]|nr:hypothetical protein BC832DRAFT_597262 [Gaertneriomyces semiglobifer]